MSIQVASSVGLRSGRLCGHCVRSARRRIWRCPARVAPWTGSRMIRRGRYGT